MRIACIEGESIWRSQDEASVPPKGILNSHGRGLMPVVNVVHGFHKFFKQQHDVPVVLGRALDVATLPLFFHQIGDLKKKTKQNKEAWEIMRVILYNEFSFLQTVSIFPCFPPPFLSFYKDDYKT